ncbi:MAG: hypothetical protein A2268_05505 [Candidatus Raymondbacteria bacterium RifOxyA12_full_50_37]|uniref:DUF3098 domain-containing protein n=1 Tax=Candidatus Raymondbacteria bacterium RIFOXYD12_FULL_49_13 TaxID=1817890 RepID=A0A1F7FBK7_UNCRA
MNTILSKRNLAILAAGVVTILAGYLCLASGTADGVLSLSVAPVLLVLGYCVIIPAAFLVKNKDYGGNGENKS